MPNLTTLELVAGWSGAVPLTLEADGAAVVLTGLTVVAVLYDRDGAAVNVTGNVAVTSAALGQIAWTPDAADLTAAASPYELRFKVTDADSKDLYFPNAQAVRVVARR